VKRTITVLQDDIDKGVKNDPYSCAIALAVKRDLNRDLVTVGYHLDIGGLKFANLPPEARNFVRDFDNGEAVKPFKFEVDIKELP
jgi:hypothetical protein